MKQFIVCFLLFTFVKTDFAQTTFLVTDGEGFPISGVLILKKGKLLGNTDKEGMFRSEFIAPNDTLLFSSEKSYNPLFYCVTQSLTTSIQEVELEEKTIEIRTIEELESTVAVPDFEQKDSIIYQVTEVSAQFPGGEEAFKRWLSKTLQIPTQFKSKKQMNCYVQLIVEKNGKISSVEVLKGVPSCPECDKETMRVLQIMPNWNPAFQNGKSVRSNIQLAIPFSPK